MVETAYNDLSLPRSTGAVLHIVLIYLFLFFRD